MATTRIDVSRAASGRLRVGLHGDVLVPRLVGVDGRRGGGVVQLGADGAAPARTHLASAPPQVTVAPGCPVGPVARVVLVSSGALLLGGDELDVEIRVGPGAALELEDAAALVAYDGCGAPARVVVRLDVEGRLAWHAEPFVVSDGADVTRTLTGSVADGGRLLLRESLVLGRHGQRGGALTSRVRLTHAGRAAVAEDLDLRDTGDLPAPGDGCGPHGACATRDLPGVLRGHRVLDQVLALGWTPPTGPDAEEASGATRLELARPGTLARWSGVAGHDSPIGDLAEAWGRTRGVTSS